MTTNKELIFEQLVFTDEFDKALDQLGMSWCDTCKDYVTIDFKDHSKGCTGHPDTWEAPNIVAYCDECGIEL